MWFTPQTERVIVLSKILVLNKSLALLLSVLLASSVGTISIEQYRRISCHDNFVKAACQTQGCFFTCARPILENDVLSLNVFLLLANKKDLVGYYKFRDEVMVWFMQMIGYNVYIPLQMMRRKLQFL